MPIYEKSNLFIATAPDPNYDYKPDAIEDYKIIINNNYLYSVNGAALQDIDDEITELGCVFVCFDNIDKELIYKNINYDIDYDFDKLIYVKNFISLDDLLNEGLSFREANNIIKEREL